MKAMIFSAGLGTRLRPLTNEKPKALIEINGEPMLGMLIRRLAESGFDQIIINVHHFADQIRDYLRKNKNFNLSIVISDETSLLLDTGGGLKNVEWFFDDKKPFLVYNVDILSDMDLGTLMKEHDQSGGLATLVVRDRESSRYLLFDDKLRLCGWENMFSKERIISKTAEKYKRFAFSGIHVLNPGIFPLITKKGVFSIIEAYLKLAGDEVIRGYPENESIWMDLGKREGLIEAEKFFLNN